MRKLNREFNHGKYEHNSAKMMFAELMRKDSGLLIPLNICTIDRYKMVTG